MVPPQGGFFIYMEHADGRRIDGWEQFPDYLNDLNDMHDAEKTLTVEQSEDYAEYLCRSICGQPPERVSICEFAHTIHATAAQRAEAFLKTLNLWDSTK